LFAALYVCVSKILSFPWFSKELKNDLSKNNWLHDVILIPLVRESIFTRRGFLFLIVLVPTYKLFLCHTPIKPDLLDFFGISIFACGLIDRVFKRFASSREIVSIYVVEVMYITSIINCVIALWTPCQSLQR